MIRALGPSEFTQGTLFSHAVAEAYPDICPAGLVITARCDTAQDKTNILNYLPVVPLEAWMLKDGVDILAKRAEADARGNLKSCLLEAGLSVSILETLDVEVIESELAKDCSRKGQGIASRFSAARALHIRARDVRNAYRSDDQSHRRAFISDRQREAKGLIKELVTNALAEFHYVSGLSSSDEENGFIVLLREVRPLAVNFGQLISEGLAFEDYCVKRTEGLSAQLSLRNKNDFSMPLGAIESPYIELILQRFSQLFSRIGVADVSKDRITALQNATVALGSK